MTTTLAQLEEFARENGYVAERCGKRIEWWNIRAPGMIGVCLTIGAALAEISSDIAAREARVRQAIADGREWLCECFPSQEEEICGATDGEIRSEIERHYDGGFQGFLRDMDA